MPPVRFTHRLTPDRKRRAQGLNMPPAIADLAYAVITRGGCFVIEDITAGYFFVSCEIDAETVAVEVARNSRVLSRTLGKTVVVAHQALGLASRPGT